MVIRLATSLLAGALLAACAAGPDHVRPDLPLADGFAATGAAAQAPSAQPDPAFWRDFRDPLLDALVEDALRANHDLRIALASVDRARALARQSRLDQLPAVTASAGAASERRSRDQAPGVPRAGRDGDAYSAGIEAAWELDLFGRVRRGVEAGRADVDAVAADLAAMQVLIAADVTRSYIELRGLQERLRVADANAGNQRQTLDLVRARFDAGRGSRFDTARASAQLDGTLARIPQLQAQLAEVQQRLAVLTGRMPGAPPATLDAPAPLPRAPAVLDPGTPGQLLRQRPDIAAAEGRLHAATARIGVATGDLFPRFTLGGLIGSQAADAAALFERGSETRRIALGIDWSFLDIGRVRARIAAADADAEAALARYEQVVLAAVAEVEAGLVRHARTAEEDALLGRAAEDSANAARIARMRFEVGSGDLLEVLDAERTRLQAEDAHADARMRTGTAAVALYRALAGGWPERAPVRRPLAGRD